jgi:MFS family permease
MLRNRTLLAVSLAVFVAYTGIGMVGPVRVLYAQSQGASLAIIGAMASAYLISNFLFQYPVGWLADRWGRKQVLVVGFLVQAILALAYLFIVNPIQFVFLRLLEGAASAGVLPTARALIVDEVPPEKRGEAYGIFGAAFNAGFLLGPGIGGLLATTSYNSAFIGAVVFRLLAIVITVTLIQVKPGSMTTAAKSTTAIPYRQLFTLPLVGAYLLAFGDYLYLGFDQTIMPIWMHNNLGASVAVIGFAYMTWAVPSMILSPFGGRVADRRPRSWLIIIFGLAQVPLYIAYGLISAAIFIVALFAVQGCFYAFVQPAVDSHVATASATDVRARVQGMYTTFGLIGAFVGANVFSPLYAINFRLPLFVLGISYGIFILVGGSMIRFAEARDLIPGSVAFSKESSEQYAELRFSPPPEGDGDDGVEADEGESFEPGRFAIVDDYRTEDGG